MIDTPLDSLKESQINHYAERYPKLTRDEIKEVLDSEPVDYAMKVRAALKLLGEAVDELEGGPINRAF